MATDSKFNRETKAILKRRSSAPVSQEMADLLAGEAEKFDGTTYERLSSMAATVQSWADSGYDAQPDDVNRILAALASVLAHHARVGASA
jgi:hypothetical protein